MSSLVNTRRWPRHPVELPVLVFPDGEDSKFTVPGRGIEISEGGMTLYAGVPLEPGDLMDIEFQTPSGARIAAIVRHRTGYCFGLEFLTPLCGDTAKASARKPAAPAQTADVKQVLGRKEIEIQRLRKEIDALRLYGKRQR